MINLVQRYVYLPFSARGGPIFMAVSFAVAVLGVTEAAFLPFAAHAETNSVKVRVPESIKYIFYLPWCRQWKLVCSICEKRDKDIVCDKEHAGCEETFVEYRCIEFNAPGCKTWRNGCNTCQKIWFTTWRLWRPEIYCTQMGCAEYHAPNAPSFECLLPKSK
jgi:hypothetical protein